MLGIEREIVIDDYIPFDKRALYKDKPFFEQVSDTGASWAIFLEKAYAKVFGYFDRI